MERIEFGTPDLKQENIQRLGELFPQVLTEVQDENGQVQRAVDFDVLRDLLGDVAEDTRERYQFTWPGKREAKAEARRPIRKTMRPCPEESVNWDTTENLYIEGDNLDALKILKETYAGKVKMIYIDPPYNTGHDFVYDDDFAKTHGEYAAESGDYDGEGGRLVANPESNGRFHSDWCSMMYPRLMLARDLLSADGAIFISIDDNEQTTLKKVCDEVFAESNFIADIVWKRKRGRDNSARWFSKAHEYCLVYAKNVERFETGYLEMDTETRKAYKNPDGDARGDYRVLGCWARGTQGGVKYSFTSKDGKVFSERLWLFSKENLAKLDNEDKLIFHGDKVYRKMFLTENKGKIPETLWDDVSNAANASDEIKRLFGTIAFDTAKPIPYVKRMLQIATGEGAVVLDFFSGSATTAHAVMQLNAEDGGNRKCILVQLPEETDAKSEAAKAGYANICEIGKERIRRAGAKIAAEVEEANKQLKLGEEPKKIPDIGFRVLKIDSTNFTDVMATPDNTSQQMLLDFSDNLKDGRSDMDILFEVLPKFQIPYSAKIEELSICGKRCFSVDDGYLLACFDRNVDNDTIEAIAKMQPYYAVMRDASMADDATHANFEELFKTYSPDTIRRVI